MMKMVCIASYEVFENKSYNIKVISECDLKLK